MIIKKLLLNNFRQFSGEQIIEFSTDPNKKATLVIAQNGTGKTTIIESFSWVLYGSTKIKSVVNSEQKENLVSGQSIGVSGEITLLHLGKEYCISRTQRFTKIGNGLKAENSVLRVSYKGENGILKEKKGMDADKEVNNIVPEELFPYFFFKGENIEKIGKEINTSKSTKNNEFVKAIKGMLGFNWLYQTRDDLKVLSAQYNDEIASNKTDGKLADLANRERQAEFEKDKYEKELDRIESELINLYQRKEELDIIIQQSVGVAQKQRESKELSASCERLKNEINILKKKLFECFSSDSFTMFSDSLIQRAIELLEDEEIIDKGIPGIEASAIEYFLKNKKCICGTPLIEGSKEYKELEDLIKYLPPNNIGSEISTFRDNSSIYKEQSEKGYQNLLERRKNLSDKITQYNINCDKLKAINEQIKNYDDVSKIKAQEIDCTNRINSLIELRGSDKYRLQHAINDLDSISKERSSYSVTDGRNKKIIDCKWHVDALISQIDKYCGKKEAEKRNELQDAINSIYKEIFKMGVSIELDENYNIIKNAEGLSDLSDYEASTSQDAIMAFSFIGGIIKLARDKVLGSDDEIMNIDNTEPYPLVMDAPSSSFDIARIENFCNLMPKIAEQVIFFIKDTDGLYVKNYLKNIIGKQYKFKKMDQCNTIIEEGDYE